MTERELTEALKRLGLDRESGRVLALLPLVQVAWADGTVQDAERALIVELADNRFRIDAEGHRMLVNWLTHAPSAAYARDGRNVLVAVCELAGQRGDLQDVVQFSQDVARAAGGYFGFGAVRASEAECIEEIAKALHIEHDRPWVTPDDLTMVPADADRQNDGPSPEVVFHPSEGPVSSPGTLTRDDALAGDRGLPVTAEGIKIGRARESTIQISYDAQVSRSHCHVFERDGRFYVKDLGSTCGTVVNGERVVERRLFGGERIHVGSAGFLFQLSPPA